MKKYSYTYLSKVRFLFILLSMLFTVLIGAVLLLVSIKPSINWSIFILFSLPILFVILLNLLARKQAEIKTLLITDIGIQYDDQLVMWEQIKWYRFDHSPKGSYEKIVIQTLDERFRIHYFDTKSHKKDWKQLKNNLKIAIEENCPDLEKAKLF
ncbi:hypothetical protein ACT3CE_17570 [Marinifilum sp. RC60d5]|uniref:hypothetical protein n=1 Tax=Marinifilum sp. RC60d5 TaxID=3458414 RepID=UPI0040354D3E